MKQLRILEANEVGHGILIEMDAGWVSPKDIRNSEMLKEAAMQWSMLAQYLVELQ